MNIRLAPCNIILFLLLLTLTASCKTTGKKKDKDKDKQASTLRVHLEVNPDGTPFNAPIPIYREKPMLVNVARDAVLDEGYIVSAAVVDVDNSGGFAIKVQYDQHGTLVLHNTTTAYRGQRLAIFSSFGQIRWLAAPVIKRTVTDGVLVFTPDATREEAERVVLGLNNIAKKLRKPYIF